jgi:hypothetical protein
MNNELEGSRRGLFQLLLWNLPTGNDEFYRKPISELPVPCVFTVFFGRAIMRLGSVSSVSQWAQMLKALVA